MAYRTIMTAELQVGQDVTAWGMPDGNHGQGGIVTRITDGFFESVSGTNGEFHHTFAFEDVHHLTVDEPLPANECLEFHTGNCQGPVEYCPTPPQGIRALPRCEFHNTQRWEQFESSTSERYAHSDAAPPGFNRSWGGANEYGEYFEED